MSSHQRHFILGSVLAVTAIVATLLATLRPNSNNHLDRSQKGRFGSAEEAFDVASGVIKEYVPTIDSDPVLIDPHFRATLLSHSKIWTVKGFASCPSNGNKAYQWTVILNYQDMQDWEILAKIVTPEYFTYNTGMKEGVTQAQGKLFHADGAR